MLQRLAVSFPVAAPATLPPDFVSSAQTALRATLPGAVAARGNATAADVLLVSVQMTSGARQPSGRGGGSVRIKAAARRFFAPRARSNL